jgi:hypothetical protein
MKMHSVLQMAHTLLAPWYEPLCYMAFFVSLFVMGCWFGPILDDLVLETMN